MTHIPDDRELLALAEVCSLYNFDSVEFVECKHKLWNDIISYFRSAALPKEAEASREELVWKIGHMLSGHSFALIHGGHHEEVASKIVDGYLSRLASKSADDGVRKELRRFAVVQCHRMAEGGGTVHVGWHCKSCDAEWGRHEPEKHKPECPAALQQHPTSGDSR